MISFATHPRWPLRLPSLISFPSIRAQTPGSIDAIFLWLIEGNEWKVPVDVLLRRSSKMVTMAAILDLVSVDYLMNACVNWSNVFVAHWGSSIFTIYHFFLNLNFHIPTDNFPLGGICHALCSPCLYHEILYKAADTSTRIHQDGCIILVLWIKKMFDLKSQSK
jgi:hypothetical protein